MSANPSTSDHVSSQPAPKIASYEAQPGEVKKCVLLFSGGLDSTIMVPWLRENYGCEVVTFTANLGDPFLDLATLGEKARAIGASEAYTPDLVDQFADEYLSKAVLANAEYGGAGGGYHLSCPLGRVLIATEAVRLAQEIGADAIAHGCTGKGNDQVRFDSYILTLAPEMKIVAPVREWNMGRDEEYEYAKARNLPVPPPRSDSGAAYSNDDNLWGFTAEGGDIEYPERVPPMHEILRLCTPPDKAPAKADELTLRFENGLPVALNGAEKKLSALIAELNQLGGKHGIGYTILIEDRIVGLKVRGVYENPAAHILIEAHRNLERITKTRDLLDTKAMLDRQFSNYVYDARWYDQVMEPLWAFIAAANENVTGEVTMSVCRGHSVVTAVQSPYAMFDANLATFETVKAGRGFNTAAAAPFIELYSLQNRQAYAIRNLDTRLPQADGPAGPG